MQLHMGHVSRDHAGMLEPTHSTPNGNSCRALTATAQSEIEAGVLSKPKNVYTNPKQECDADLPPEDED